MHVKDVDTAGFMTEVVERSRQVPVVVDFWAEWCQPCKQLSPVLERLAAEYDGAWELAKIDVDANQQLAAQFGVQSIPLVVAFVGGQPAAQFSGVQPEAQIRQWLSQFVQPPGDARMHEINDLLDKGADQAAEIKLRDILAAEPNHADAAPTLVALLIDQGRQAEALTLLDTLPPSTEVDRLRATAALTSAVGELGELRRRVAEDPTDTEARIAFNRARAAVGEAEAALDDLMEIVAEGGDFHDSARQAAVEIFGLLGPEDPLVTTYRRRLANLLF